MKEAAARWKWPLALASCIAAAGARSVSSRLDANWDLKNYHFYNAYAFLNGRLGWDIAPAQLQTYHNPLLDLPFYHLVQAVASPRVIAFVMASTTGVAAFFLLRMLAVVFPKGRVEDRGLWIALAFAVGMTGAMGQAGLGTTMNDWPPAMLLMVALAMVVQSIARHGLASLPAVALAGLMTGLAVGLKLTHAVFGAGLVAAVAASGSMRERTSRTLVAGTVMFVGFLATYAPWGAALYREFENPFFPYFNTVFKSPWWEPAAFFDRNFGPRDALQWLFFPLYFARESRLVSEVPFRDWRLAVLLVLALLAAAKYALQRRRGALLADAQALGDGRAWRFLAVFTAVSYLIWLKVFGIYRYLVPLEMLSGPLVVGAALYLVPGRNARRAFIVILVTLIMGTTRPANWGRLPFRGAYFDVAVPDVAPRSLVIMGPAEPMAYAIPFVRPDTRFVYPTNNFLHHAQPNRLARQAKDVIDGHAGPIYTMDFLHRNELEEVLGYYGLARDLASCLPIRSYLDTSAMRLCRAHRSPQPRQGTAP